MSIVRFIRSNPIITIPLLKWKKSVEYNRFMGLLVNSESWSPEEVDAWQLNAVSEMVDYAYQNVPAYKEKYDQVGFKVGDIKSWRDFEKLPFLEKDEIKNNTKSFVSKIREPANDAFTSGSTGKPMKYLLDVATGERERAMFHYYWRKNGYNFGEPCVLLRGQNVGNPENNIFFQYDRFQNYKMFNSTYATRPENLETYCKQMGEFGATVLQAYPSSAYSFAKLCVEQGIDAPHFKLVFLGSEGLTPEQCEFIKDVFRAEKVMYHYGHSECAALAMRYPNEDKLGFVPVYGYTEIINNNTVCRDVGEFGEIVATGFNRSMPFIRYKTGDYTTTSQTNMDSFMRNCKPVELIEGRKQEYLVTATRRLVPVVWLCGQHMKSLALLKDFQYEQFEPGKLIVKVVLQKEEEQQIRQRLTTEFNTLLEDVDVVLESVDSIQKNSRGKRISMIQHLDVDAFREEKTMCVWGGKGCPKTKTNRQQVEEISHSYCENNINSNKSFPFNADISAKNRMKNRVVSFQTV